MNGFVLRLPNGIQDSKGGWTKEVEIDEMGGEEEDLLVDQAREQGGSGAFRVSGPRRITSILSRCTVRIGNEKRPEGKDRYDLPDFFEKQWASAFSSDRVFAMVRLRQLSLDNVYTFTKNCPTCKKEIPNIRVDLDGLEVQDIPLDKVQESHLTTLPRSRDIVAWHFQRGVDEDEIDRIMKEHKSDFISAVLYRRIDSVREYDPATNSHGPPTKPEGGLLYTKRMRAADRRFMATEFDAGEGGIDVNIIITCDNAECRTEFTTKLSVMGGDFFFPSATPSPSISTSARLPSAGGTPPKPSSGSPSAAADG
jgi:hypothetical protein